MYKIDEEKSECENIVLCQNKFYKSNISYFSDKIRLILFILELLTFLSAFFMAMIPYLAIIYWKIFLLLLSISFSIFIIQNIIQFILKLSTKQKITYKNYETQKLWKEKPLEKLKIYLKETEDGNIIVYDNDSIGNEKYDVFFNVEKYDLEGFVYNVLKGRFKPHTILQEEISKICEYYLLKYEQLAQEEKKINNLK